VHPVWEVITTQQPLLVGRVGEEYLTQRATSDEHERFMRTMGYRSLLVVPLVSKTQGVLGAMTMVRVDDNEMPYDQAELRFAQDLARRCASAIAKSMLHAQTVNIATNFQQAALPRSLPRIAGLALDAIYEPSSKELLVGGDWHDAFPMPDGRIALTIGDVLGHGIAAAVWMGRLRNALRAALISDPDPARALAVTDRVMRIDSQDEFSTALVAVIDPVHQTMTCASAGHPGPLIWDGESSVMDPFTDRTLPLGLRSLGDDVRTAQVITLRPGSFAAFFTDGLLE
jgi:serine phosphatase RsbU (regulator of sigma subunit)